METTVLVAFNITDVISEKHAQEALMGRLPRPAQMLTKYSDDGVLDCWWIAEDERYDGSDNDSAVFAPGYADGAALSQEAAHRLLRATQGVDLAALHETVERLKVIREQVCPENLSDEEIDADWDALSDVIALAEALLPVSEPTAGSQS